MSKARKRQIRTAFREDVFSRDGYACQVCGRQWRPEDSDPVLKRVNAHHITNRKEMPNGGYVPENGITVCDVAAFADHSQSCHMRVEQWHITGGAKVEEGLDPETLYRIIGSSYDEAVRASRSLE